MRILLMLLNTLAIRLKEIESYNSIVIAQYEDKPTEEVR